jgi:protein-tyrosine phosphatase
MDIRALNYYRGQIQMNQSEPVRVLFVCMGNICRSPTAQGVFRSLVEKEGLSENIQMDSAGTIGIHAGEQPDRRARSIAKQRGVDLSDLRGRQVSSSDFEKFDYVIAMDRSNYNDLTSVCPRGSEEKLHLLMDFASHVGVQEVPDPYYGGAAGFERVFDLIETASEGLLQMIREKHLLDGTAKDPRTRCQ